MLIISSDINFVVDIAVKLSLDLIEEWLSKNSTDMMAGAGGGSSTGLRGIATYQPMDGLFEFKMVRKTNKIHQHFLREKFINVYAATLLVFTIPLLIAWFSFSAVSHFDHL